MSIKPAHDLNAPRDVSERLRRLDEILATPEGSSNSRGVSTDAADSMLGLVMAERIRRITSLLGGNRTTEVDTAEVLTMRVLLVEYLAAVRHLRAVARITEQRLSTVAATIADCQRL